VTDQELKVKALELTIKTIALMSEKDRFNQLSRGNPVKIIIDFSLDYQNYLKGEPT
jgi:hypothetical protein